MDICITKKKKTKKQNQFLNSFEKLESVKVSRFIIIIIFNYKYTEKSTEVCTDILKIFQ